MKIFDEVVMGLGIFHARDGFAAFLQRLAAYLRLWNNFNRKKIKWGSEIRK